VRTSRAALRNATLGAALLLAVGAGRAWALGAVRTKLSGDKLTITGDDAPNSIQIIGGVGQDTLVVVGLDATLVNGSALSTTVAGVKALSIDVKGSADSVELIDVVLDKTLTVTLGGGSDSFVMQGGRVTTKAQIAGGGDGDDIRIRGGARFGGQMIVPGGKKVDTIVVTDASIGGDSEVKGGAGNDDVTVQFTTVDGGANLIVGGGDGSDRTTLLDDGFDDVQIYMGNGNDRLVVEGSHFDGTLKAQGNGGHDEIDVDGGNTFDPGHPRKVSGFEDLD
jgi:hypothetical protein